MEDIIYNYYELLYSQRLEESQELLDWNIKEASIIDYYSTMNKMATKYKIKRVKDIVITAINETDQRGEAVVNIIYEDEDQKEIIEVNWIKGIQNIQKEWKITSIRRK
ncbi:MULTISPECIES: hypothetical protein [Paenibacillus]|uniref:Tim44-like domain-containing protein n=1 Tax=Paenibacillus cucumis (ex Kampfer et al. 2016) TaxID=1776858 RepID=A0ABS7KE77_9BACL|nr:hypothetical protein [Paenibacillus cucumis (ex Kampfer et al. 2016)]MBY0202445.1 hypothetical protein [Paenibacillus cucumis (ex Kampfer et al. 2016)]